MSNKQACDSFSIIIRRYDDKSDSFKYELVECVSSRSNAKDYVLYMDLEENDIVAVCDTAYAAQVSDMAEFIYFVDEKVNTKLAAEPHKFFVKRAKEKERLGCSWLWYGEEYASVPDLIYIAHSVGVDRATIHSVCESWTKATAASLKIYGERCEEFKSVSNMIDDTYLRGEEIRSRFGKSYKSLIHAFRTADSILGYDDLSIPPKCCGHCIRTLIDETHISHNEANYLLLNIMLKMIPLRTLLSAIDKHAILNKL